MPLVHSVLPHMIVLLSAFLHDFVAPGPTSSSVARTVISGLHAATSFKLPECRLGSCPQQAVA